MNTRTLRTGASALTLGLTLGLLAGCGDDTEPTSADDSNSPTSSDTPSTGEPSTPSEPSSTDEPSTGDTVAAPVYFVGDSPQGPRLFRELHDVADDNALEEAAAILLAGDALDPDYRTLLQAVRIESIAQEDGAIVVTLAEDSAVTADKSVAPADAELAVQSLVYTLQGTAQTRDPVRVELADGTPTPLLGVPTEDGVRAADPLEVLNLVNVTVPQEGATVSGTFTVEGVASSFEATVPWELRDESGAAVVEGFSTAEGWADRLYPWTGEVDVSTLAPGTYTFVALTDDPSDGEGPGPHEDSKTVTVE